MRESKKTKRQLMLELQAAYDRIAMLESNARSQLNPSKHQSNIHIQDFFNILITPIFHKGVDGRYLDCNAAFERLVGRDRGEIVGKTVYEIAPIELADTYNEMDKNLFQNGGVQRYESEVQANNGTIRNVLAIKSILHNSCGDCVGLVGELFDITEQKRLDGYFRESEERFRRLAEESPVSIMAFDRDGLVNFVSKWHLQEFCKDRLSASYFLGRHICDLPGLVSAGCCEEIKSILFGNIVHLNEVHVPSSSIGTESYQNIRGVPFVRDGKVVGGVLIREDITERKRMELLLEKAATIDRLTGIQNRQKIEHVLESEINRSLRYKTVMSLVMFDIDFFKNVNDTYGHSFGDQVLKNITSIVASNIRSVDYFGRWGGEEFMLVLPETCTAAASILAEKLRCLIGKSVVDNVRNITCSFGVTQFMDMDSMDEIIKRVDTALYKAKRNGRNRVEIA